MSRLKPANHALQDRVIAVLIDAHPWTLTTAEIAERVGGKKMLTMRCLAGLTLPNGAVARCRADLPADVRFVPIAHHEPDDGSLPFDSWHVPYSPMDVGRILRRLETKGYDWVRRAGSATSPALKWQWVGPMPTRDIADLEQLWSLPPHTRP